MFNYEKKRDLFSINRTSILTGLDPETIKKGIKAKQIRAVQIGNRLYVPVAEIERLLSPLAEKPARARVAKRLDGGRS